MLVMQILIVLEFMPNGDLKSYLGHLVIRLLIACSYYMQCSCIFLQKKQADQSSTAISQIRTRDSCRDGIPLQKSIHSPRFSSSEYSPG